MVGQRVAMRLRFMCWIYAQMEAQPLFLLVRLFHNILKKEGEPFGFVTHTRAHTISTTAVPPTAIGVGLSTPATVLATRVHLQP